MLEFIGNPAPLQDADFARAAAAIGCAVAAVRAVCDVESRGGFLADGRPKILFERHVFRRHTGGRFDATFPAISQRTPGGYLGGGAEYDRLARAIACDRDAALKSASWGAFQIMGFNHEAAGFADVEAFVRAMVSGAGAQLDAFIRFIMAAGLDDELIRRDWPAFARGYNGADYARSHYHTRLAAAYTLHRHGGARTDNPQPVLRMGDRGVAVRRLQVALGLKADGDFGPETKAAVIAAQKSAGLHADGIAGQQTWSMVLGREA